MLKDRIEPIVVRRVSEENSKYFRAEVPQVEIENDLDEGFRVLFSAGKDLIDKLEQVWELVFGNFGPRELEPLLERIVDDYIERYCPRAKARRRQEKEERKGNRLVGVIDAVKEVSEAVAESSDTKDRDSKRSRYVSDALREKIYERDGYCCTYVAPDGTKCNCRSELQVDLVVPFALGGWTGPANLRTVCRAHNLLYARQSYGDDYIEDIVARRKVGRDGRPRVAPQPGDFINRAEELLFG